MKLSDGEYDRGIAVHSPVVLQYDLGGSFGRFKGKVGFQDPEGKLGNAAVRILGDGKPLFDRPEARGDQPPEEFDVSVAGVRTLASRSTSAAAKTSATASCGRTRGS